MSKLELAVSGNYNPLVDYVAGCKVVYCHS